MADAFLGYHNIIDRATTSLTATNTQSTLPAANLAHAHVSKVMRCSGGATAIEVDAGSSVLANCLAMFGMNLTGTATMRIRASDTDYTTGDLLDTGVITPDLSTTYKCLLKVFAAAVTARYWRVDLTDTGILIEIGRLVICPTVTPAVNISYPYAPGLLDPSLVRETIGGQAITYKRTKRKTSTFVWGFLTESEAITDLLGTVDRIDGRSQDVLWVKDHESSHRHREMVWGRLQQVSSVFNRAFDLYEHEYRVVEST